VLYHAVAGEAPPPATERVHKDELDIAALGLSASLTNALRLGLAVDHHNRPQRMTEFQALLLGDKEPILTSAITPPPKTGLRSSEEESAPEVAPVSTKQTQNQSTSSLAKWAILAALIVGVIITIMIVGVGEQKKVAPSPDVATPTAVPPAPTIVAAPIAAPEDPDTTLWNEAKASGERKRLDAYLKQYPKGKFVELAEIELKKLDERSTAENDRLEAEKKQATEQLKADQLRAEQQVWDQAKADNTPNAYAAYLNSYPKGRFSSLALKAQQIAHEEAAKRERQAAEEAARRELEAKEAEAERVRQESIRKAAEARRPGRSFKDCDECPEMVVIAAGSFQMGSPLTEKSRHSDESPIRTVTISQPFSIGKYEITFDEWLACVRANGCKSAPNPNHSGYGRGRRPVINVSLTDAREYVKWLSSKTGWDYRLPSEAQWEYVARAGSRAAFSFGATIEPSQANFDGRSSYAGSKKSDIYLRQTVPVGQYPANAFGVHDMHGNVSEWVDDCWNPSYENAPSDGSARTDGECDWSILRGGSHNDDADRLRTALRRNVASFGILNRSHFTGFRVVRHGF
jgi:formylglycine-generating enzyme required for sulfatase activity